jgi:hypothetical protein
MAVSAAFEKKLYSFLFLFFAVLVIVPVWWYSGFITADGPCHVYNAGVYKDFITGNASFYKGFYTVNTDLEPNWFSHILLAGLMFLFSPYVADKVLISVCILNFAFAFRYFIMAVKSGNDYLSVAIFPFLWQFAMLMGFYNYMFSIGCMFWLTGYWLHHHTHLTLKKGLLLSLACILVYFMHLLGIFLSAAIMGLVSLTSTEKGKSKETIKELLTLIVIMLPAGLLMLNYIAHNSSTFNNEYKQSLVELWHNLRGIFSLQSIHPDEFRLTVIIAKVIALYFIYALVKLLFRQGNGKLWVVALAMMIVLVLSYFFAYESMLGGSYIRYRLESMIYIFALITVATVAVPIYLRFALVLFFSAVTLIYFGGRWGAYKDAGTMVNEFRSLRPFIEDKSVVLPLKYVDFPTDYRNEKQIASHVLLFSHVAESIYDGDKQLIFTENYEANTGYFPLLWKEEVNPFKHLGPSIEGTPPNVDIAGYISRAHSIDYIVVWGRQGDILQNPLTQSVGNYINEYFELVHTTPLYKIELYERKMK